MGERGRFPFQIVIGKGDVPQGKYWLHRKRLLMIIEYFMIAKKKCVLTVFMIEMKFIL